MKRQVNFALIGVGGISQSQHLPNMKRAEGVYLSTVCDLRENVLEQAKQKYQVPQATTNYEEVLKDPRIEAVLIATQAESHVSLTLQALNAGKHVYVEKPLAQTSEECRKVSDAQKKSGKRVAVGFNRRLAPAIIKAREILQAVDGVRHMHYRISDAYWIWGMGTPPGLRVVHEVCHIFDLLCYLAGSEVDSVYCVAARDDDETIVLRFKNRVVASIMSSGYGHYDLPKEAIEIIVKTGGITIHEFVELETFGLEGFLPCYRFAGHSHPDREVLHKYLFEKMGFDALKQVRRVFYENHIKLETLRAGNELSIARDELELYDARSALINYMVDKGWIGAIEHFAACILDDQLHCELATSDDGLKAAIITEAAIKSRQSGQVVHIDDSSKKTSCQASTAH